MMPRRSRIDAAGALHHVMVRGMKGRTVPVPISTVMRRLLTGYALWYNRKHHRDVHLFQNRFKSILCQEDIYLLELVRYIHLNPIRALGRRFYRCPHHKGIAPRPRTFAFNIDIITSQRYNAIVA